MNNLTFDPRETIMAYRETLILKIVAEIRKLSIMAYTLMLMLKIDTGDNIMLTLHNFYRFRTYK